MTIEASRYRVSHPDRHLACQEAVERDLLEIIDKANMGGWGTVETMDAIEEVMKHLRLAYAEDPDPAEEPVMDARLFLHKHPTDQG
jgi:hypothetical protein